MIDEYLSIFAGKVVDFYLIYTCGGGIIKIKGLFIINNLGLLIVSPSFLPSFLPAFIYLPSESDT